MESVITVHLVKKKSSLHLSPKWFPLLCPVSKGLIFKSWAQCDSEREDRVSKDLEIDKMTPVLICSDAAVNRDARLDIKQR